MEEKRKPGRPTGRRFPARKLTKMTDAQLAELKRLAAHWGCSENEAVRRALRETARREGVE